MKNLPSVSYASLLGLKVLNAMRKVKGRGKAAPAPGAAKPKPASSGAAAPAPAISRPLMQSSGPRPFARLLLQPEADAKAQRAAERARLAAEVAKERKRCAAIVRHGVKLSAAQRGDPGPLLTASWLAFDTDVDAQAAVQHLDALGALHHTRAWQQGQGNSLHSRMHAEQYSTVRADAGESAAPGSVTGTVQTILAAGARARGEA